MNVLESPLCSRENATFDSTCYSVKVLIFVTLRQWSRDSEAYDIAWILKMTVASQLIGMMILDSMLKDVCLLLCLFD